MKNRLAVSCVALNLLLPCAVFGQSSFLFWNCAPPEVDAPVCDALGTRLSGPSYLAELWGGPAPDSLTPALIFDQSRRREIVAFATDGYFFSSSAFLCVMTVPPNGWAWLQVRAWEARLGGTYEEVAALGIGGYGESPLFYARGGDPGVLAPPPPLVGLQSFFLLPVIPEPNGAVLLLLGLPLLLWRKCSPK